MNTARMARRLHERGLEGDHADALAEIIGEEVEAGLVTNATLDARLAQFEARIGGRIGELESRIGGLEGRMGGLESRMEHVEARLGGVERSVGEVETRVGDKITNLVKAFAGIAIVQTATIIGAVRLLLVA